jgi:hypothetical protein
MSRLDQSSQLERKLQLMLGSRRPSDLTPDWLTPYLQWLRENGTESEVNGYPSPEAYQDHNINLFVRQQRARRAA